MGAALILDAMPLDGCAAGDGCDQRPVTVPRYSALRREAHPSRLLLAHSRGQMARGRAADEQPYAPRFLVCAERAEVFCRVAMTSSTWRASTRPYTRSIP